MCVSIQIMADPSLFVGRVIEMPVRGSTKNLALISAFNNGKYTLALPSGKLKDVKYSEVLDGGTFFTNEEAQRLLDQRGLRKVSGYGIYGLNQLNNVSNKLIVIKDTETIKKFGGVPSNTNIVVKVLPGPGRLKVQTPSGVKKAIKRADITSGKLVLYDPRDRPDLQAKFTTQQQQARNRVPFRRRLDAIRGKPKKTKTLTQVGKPRETKAYKKVNVEIKKKQNRRNELASNALIELGALKSTMAPRNKSESSSINLEKKLENVLRRNEIERLNKNISAMKMRRLKITNKTRVAKTALSNYIIQKVSEGDVNEVKRVYATNFEYYAMQDAGKTQRGVRREFNRTEALTNALSAEREKVRQWTNVRIKNVILQQLDNRLAQVSQDQNRIGEKMQKITNREAGRRVRPKRLPTPKAKLAELKKQLLTTPDSARGGIEKEIKDFELFIRKTKRPAKPPPPNRVFKNSPILERASVLNDTANNDDVLYQLRMHFAQQAKRRRIQTKKLLHAAGAGHDRLKDLRIVQHAQKALPGVTKADQRLRIRLMNIASRNPSFFVIRQGGLYLSKRAQVIIRKKREIVLANDAGYVASPVREIAKVKKLSNATSLGYSLKYPIELEYRTTAANAARKNGVNKPNNDNVLLPHTPAFIDTADGSTSAGAQKLHKLLGRMGVHTGKPIGKILRGQPLSDAVAVLEALPGVVSDMYTSRQRKRIRPIGMEDAAKRGYTEEFYNSKTQDIVQEKIVDAFIRALSYHRCGCELSNPVRRIILSQGCETRTPPTFDAVNDFQIIKFKKASDTLLKRSYPIISTDAPVIREMNDFTMAFYQITTGDHLIIAQTYEDNRKLIMSNVMSGVKVGLEQIMKKYGLVDTDIDPAENVLATGSRDPQAATGGVNKNTENKARLARGDIVFRQSKSSVNLILRKCEQGLDILLEDKLFTLSDTAIERGTPRGSYHLLRYVHEQYGPMRGFNIKYGNKETSYLNDIGNTISFLFRDNKGAQTKRDALYALYRTHVFCRLVYHGKTPWCKVNRYDDMTGRVIPLAKYRQESRTPLEILGMIRMENFDDTEKYKYQVNKTSSMDWDGSDSALTRIFAFLQTAASEVITPRKMNDFLKGEEFRTLSSQPMTEDNPLTYHHSLVVWMQNVGRKKVLSFVSDHVCLPVLLADPMLIGLLSRTAVQYHLITNGLDVVAEYTSTSVKTEVFKRLRAATKDVINVKVERNKVQQLITESEQNVSLDSYKKRALRKTLAVLDNKLQHVTQKLNYKTSLKDHFIMLNNYYTEVLMNAKKRGQDEINLLQPNSTKAAIRLLFDHAKSLTSTSLGFAALSNDAKLVFSTSPNDEKCTSPTELVFYTETAKPRSKMTQNETRAWMQNAFKVHAVLPSSARGCDTESGDRNAKRRRGTSAQSCVLSKISIPDLKRKRLKIASLDLSADRITRTGSNVIRSNGIKPWLVPRELRFTQVEPSKEALAAWSQYLFDLHEWLPENTPGRLIFQEGETDYGLRVLTMRGKELDALDKKMRPNAMRKVVNVLTDDLKNVARIQFPKLMSTPALGQA